MGRAAKKAKSPLPLMQVLLICSMNLINAASYNCTMPMTPFMVMSFYPGLHETEVGFYTGVLESAFHVGAFTGAMAWGWMADTYGRRRAMLWGLLGTVLSCLAYGASGNFGMALAAKFSWGLLNGNVGVTKTALAELTDETNQARAFSFIGIATGLGRVVGASLGGMLAQPAMQYPDVFGGVAFFVAYPFLLPTIGLALVTVVTWVLSCAFLRETLPPELAGSRRRSGAPATIVETAVPAAAGAEAAIESADGDDAAAGAAAVLELEAAAAGRFAAWRRTAPAGAAARWWARRRRQRWEVACRVRPRCCAACAGCCCTLPPYMRDRAVLTSTLVYAGLSLIGIVAAEIFPLFVLNPPEHGGFSWHTGDLGMLATVCGPVLMVYQALVFDRVVEGVGVVTALRFCLGATAVFTAATPLVSITLLAPKFVQTLVIYVLYIAMTIARLSCFTCTFIVVANAARPGDRGKVNGVGQAMASLVRAVGPAVGTAVFAWSVSRGAATVGWPFDASFMWNACALATVAVLAFTYWLPPWIGRKRLPGDV